MAAVLSRVRQRLDGVCTHTGDDEALRDRVGEVVEEEPDGELVTWIDRRGLGTTADDKDLARVVSVRVAALAQDRPVDFEPLVPRADEVLDQRTIEAFDEP